MIEKEEEGRKVLILLVAVFSLLLEGPGSDREQEKIDRGFPLVFYQWGK
jgi:hypothetical protein